MIYSFRRRSKRRPSECVSHKCLTWKHFWKGNWQNRRNFFSHKLGAHLARHEFHFFGWHCSLRCTISKKKKPKNKRIQHNFANFISFFFCSATIKLSVRNINTSSKKKKKNLTSFVFRQPKTLYFKSIYSWPSERAREGRRESGWREYRQALRTPTHQFIHCLQSSHCRCIVRCQREMAAKDVNEESCPLNFGSVRPSFNNLRVVLYKCQLDTPMERERERNKETKLIDYTGLLCSIQPREQCNDAHLAKLSLQTAFNGHVMSYATRSTFRHGRCCSFFLLNKRRRFGLAEI